MGKLNLKGMTYLTKIPKSTFQEMVELKLIDLNSKDQLFAICNKQKSGKAKSYFVVDYLYKEYVRNIG